LGYNLFNNGGVAMSFFRQVGKGLLKKLFPRKDARAFNELPTRPLDSEALARALTGEGRRHVSTGYAKLTVPKTSQLTSSLYLLMAKSDGINALPDFGIVGVAESQSTDVMKVNLSKAALSAFAYHMTKKAVLDFLELEGFENSTPLQNIVVETMEITDQVIQGMNSGMEYSLTAGLILAEIMILGHRGSTRAYHIDRHHIERITAVDLTFDGPSVDNSSESQRDNEESDELSKVDAGETIVYSRPVPRDGFILLCTSGLWKNMRERDIHRIVVGGTDPQDTCHTLISQVKDKNSLQELSVLLMHFPPDFGPWR
jgi:serine/threonine protein phosphatase PrpC